MAGFFGTRHGSSSNLFKQRAPSQWVNARVLVDTLPGSLPLGPTISSAGGRVLPSKEELCGAVERSSGATQL